MLNVGAALALTAAAPLLAQQAKFCNNNLVITAAYSNVRSNGATSEVEYHAQLQNQDPQRRTIHALFAPVGRVGSFIVSRHVSNVELKPYEQKDTIVFAIRLQNPVGNGAPTPAQAVQQLHITCFMN